MPVYKDKNDTYYFITRIPKEGGGTRQVKRRGFESRIEAKKAEAEVIFNADQYDEDNPTFDFVCKEYLEWYKKRRKSSSYRKIEQVIRMHLLPALGGKKLNNIRNRDITKLHDSLIDKYAVNNIKRTHSILSGIFNFAIREEYTTNNPARNVGNVDLKQTKHINYWTLEEFKQFISVVDDDFYRALFMTLYYSGIRRGELIALTWADIDFDNNSINVDKTIYQNEPTPPKTDASIRKIMMPNHVMLLLKQLKNTVKPKTGYVVFGNVYDYLSETTLRKRFRKYIKQSQVKEIRLHDLRHSHASYLINNGEIVSVIAQRLGHGDISTTLNTYAHLYPTTEKEAVSKMEDDFKTADVIKFKVK